MTSPKASAHYTIFGVEIKMIDEAADRLSVTLRTFQHRLQDRTVVLSWEEARQVQQDLETLLRAFGIDDPYFRAEVVLESLSQPKP